MCSNINYNKIPSNDLFSALNIIILNKNIYNGATEICFELFQRLFSKYFKNINRDDVSAEQLAPYLQQLISANKFSRQLFCELLFSELKEIPLKLIAWLDEHNIYFFTQYCMNNSTSNTTKQLIQLIENNDQHEVSHIFMKIIISVYNIGITNSSKLFTIKCRKILDDFLNSSLIEFETEDPKLIYILPILNGLDSVLYGQFTKQILQKILMHHDCTIHDAFVLQEIWTVKNIPDKLLIIYYEMIRSYNLDVLLELITNIPAKNLNWKFALILISVFIRKNGHKQLKDVINRRLQILFSDQNKTVSINDMKPSSELLTCIIFMRQICSEQDNPQLYYSEWYSSTFGPNTNLRTGTDPTAFNLLLTTLTSIVNKESIQILRIHIERSIRTPSGCQSDMLVFKDVCRVQLSKIVQSEQITIKNCCIPVIILLEEALNRFDCIWALRQSNICKLLLPFINSDCKYEKLKEKILKNKILCENDVITTKVSIMKNDVASVESEAEEMLFE